MADSDGLDIDDIFGGENGGSVTTNPFGVNTTPLYRPGDLIDLNETSKPMPISSERWFILLSASLYGLIALMALIGNMIFCYVIWRSQKLHTVTHMLMTNLGICNLLFLLFHPAFFMNTYIFQTSWDLGKFVEQAATGGDRLKD